MNSQIITRAQSALIWYIEHWYEGNLPGEAKQNNLLNMDNRLTWVYWQRGFGSFGQEVVVFIRSIQTNGDNYSVTIQ
jgi:hypothetical protein